jgi:hypothetical protein
MAFIFIRPLSRCAMGLLVIAAMVGALPAGDCMAQTKAAGATESAAPSQEAQDRSTDAAQDGDSRATKAAADAPGQDRRLILLRLLVLGGGSYRPFGLFR